MARMAKENLIAAKEACAAQVATSARERGCPITPAAATGPKLVVIQAVPYRIIDWATGPVLLLRFTMLPRFSLNIQKALSTCAKRLALSDALAPAFAADPAAADAAEGEHSHTVTASRPAAVTADPNLDGRRRRQVENNASRLLLLCLLRTDAIGPCCSPVAPNAWLLLLLRYTRGVNAMGFSWQPAGRRRAGRKGVRRLW